jgi:hypothetical protein
MQVETSDNEVTFEYAMNMLLDLFLVYMYARLASVTRE